MPGLSPIPLAGLTDDDATLRLKTEPAFATKNLPLLLKKLTSWGISKPLILTHFNKIGFQMNPSREACEKSLAEYDFQVMAMGTLASGHLKPIPSRANCAGPAVRSVCKSSPFVCCWHSSSVRPKS